MPTATPARANIERVVAVVASLTDGREQIGSGYLVSDCTVLTAAHCTRDKQTDEPARALRLVRASDGISSQVDPTSVTVDNDLDIAVLSVDESPFGTGYAPAAFGRIDRNRASRLKGCHGIGFPLFQRDAQNAARLTGEFHGIIYATDGHEHGLLLLREMSIRLNTSDSPGAATPSSPTPWGGLSGALVFHQGHAVGVAIEHRPQHGDNALTLRSIDFIADASPTISQLLALGQGESGLPTVAESDAAGPFGESLQSLQRRLTPAIVGVDQVDGQPLATGFRVGQGDVVITAAYVAEASAAGGEFIVRSSDGVVANAAVVHTDGQLAALRSSTAGSVLPIGESGSLRINEHIYSLDLFGGMHSGRVAGYNENGLVRVAELNTKPGSAGAPYVDRLGRVVAVHFALHKVTGEGFGVPVEQIRSLLSQLEM